ncbi:UDP-N-acetylmuramoyl-tripeptide--D-alanyl-D-alanine ligase [Candidatus Cytomitobacter primus]|uniref:UDP-N-acetylmuramoyl-tripeptide--D-alanyl-D-alanine ligase n=1 Tax=Candidatus Cytomitobacter primus TaxID=2066024 RepID=A0A5C0UE42_9PROT|nr:UDP-N-acetylmuramoyl-tripeptide--D-alanyl-D-alanine ligase [Candidatus Cytomitobacter primus]QEK38355.1 UDP-N-acetylmuramoyl-tripeptide--D-alanyl-D-alanine ligase [Candidatus Cytomitobacter primus]
MILTTKKLITPNIMKKTFQINHNVSNTISGISIDSRIVQSGEIFFCIKGAVNDGHEFAQDALGKGAEYIVSEKNLDIPQDKLIKVENVQNALIQLTQNIRNNLKATVIAITGTAGKTSTKEQMISAFSDQNIIATPASYNTIYGLALTICNLTSDPEYLILELGINNPHEMDILSSIASPHYSIITTIGPGHIGNFENIDHIAQEKSYLLKYTQRHAFFPLICEKYCPRNLQFTITDSNSSLNSDSQVQNSKIFSINHDIHKQNAVPILLIAEQENIQNAHNNISNYKPSKGRNNILKLSKNSKRTLENNDVFTIIDGSFNSNPTSLNASIAQLQSYPNRKIAVLGEMGELGEYTAQYHNVDFGVDILILLGEKWTSKTGIILQNYKQICDYLDKIIRKDDIILLKGSNSTDIKLVVKYLEEQYKA